MDPSTLRKLEYDKIRDMLASLTGFDGGYQKAREMQPTVDYESVNRRLDETGEAMEVLRLGEPAYFHGLKRIDQALAKARVNGILQPADLRNVYRLLHSSRLAAKALPRNKYPRLAELCSGLFQEPELENRLDQAIGEDDQVRDSASPQLRSIRSQITTLRLRIKDYLQDFIRSGNNQKYLQDSLVTERDGRYVVPVKQEHRHEVRGIVHDESSSGATVFIEPMPVVENNNRIRSLQAEEKREIERIIQELSAAVQVYVQELAQNQEILSLLDYIIARGRLAYRMNAFRPEINRTGIMDINRGKHPLLGEDAVPINVQLGQRYDMLVITGPNTGGKTVTLKMVGLLALMAMSGMYVPARENSRIPIYDSIYVDIGDEQSIEQSLSTFSGHMKNIVSILEKANHRSLVLLDELGAGTDPIEGAALARVILEELLGRKSQVIITTHQSELKSFAYQNERVENACVEFDPRTLKPTYELTIGTPGQSNAFQIAGRLGLRSELVDRAKKLVPQREQEVGNMIRELKAGRQAVQSEADQLAALRTSLEAEKEAMLRDKEAFRQEHNQVIEKARREAAQYVKQVKQESNQALQEFKELLRDRQNPPRWHEVEASRKKISDLPVLIESPESEGTGLNEDIKPGDYVLVTTVNQRGQVINGPDSDGNVSVQVGMMKINVNRKNLSRVKAPPEQGYRERSQTYLEKARHISKEIDLRGKLSEEALEILDRYLDDVHLVGLDSVRIIHGKGTGALRKAVREYLRVQPNVKSYRDGLREEGGFGVTIAEF